MIQHILLVCGSRKKSFNRPIVFDALTKILYGRKALAPKGITEPVMMVAEGCCPNSADVLAEEWSKIQGVECRHFPGGPGEMLSRNIKMVEVCDSVLAFWDGYTYGTAHTIATAILKGKPVRIVKV